MAASEIGSASQTEALARTAVANGKAALESGETETALRWLDRAHRLVPADPNVVLLLATALLGRDPRAAETLFQRIAEQHNVKQAWLGLTASRFRQGKLAGARDALAAALSGHAYTEDVAPLADHLAGSAGWCALSGDGLVVRSAATVAVAVDGVAVPWPNLNGKACGDRTRKRLGPQSISVVHEKTHLLGSPIRVAAIRQLVGCVEASSGGLSLWAWHPANPDKDPVVTVRRVSTGRIRAFTLTDTSETVPDTGPLARPRRIRLSAADLPEGDGLIEVLGPDGRHLLGSPLNPYPEQNMPVAAPLLLADRDAARPAQTEASRAANPVPACARVPTAPVGAGGKKRDVAVVVPVHDGGAIARACLTGVLATVPGDVTVIVVDDASTDPDLTAYLDRLAARRRVRLIRHRRAMGFAASANAGLRAARGRDVVLLNSDTIVPSRWIERLRDAAYSAPDIGTVTPLSNDATILSYPSAGQPGPCPDAAEVKRIDRLAWKANAGGVVDIPVGVGFCLYLRRDCLNATGLFRYDIFAQGYGEENDLCLRARSLGWRSVALTGLFVGHLGGASFGSAAWHLRERNGRLLEQLHPGHDALIEDWVARNPLADARRRIDVLRLKNQPNRPSVVLISHNDGGGVEQRLRQSADTHRAMGRRPIILRPHGDDGTTVAIHDDNGIGDLLFILPREMPELLDLLHSLRTEAVEVHHLLNYGPSIYDLISNLGIPYDVRIHDYLWVCPRISFVGQAHYCGEPPPAGCKACIANHGHFLKEDITVQGLRDRSARFLAGARQVTAPSGDVASRLSRYLPGLSICIDPNENDLLTPPPPRRIKQQGRVRVCIAGGIGVHKGYEVLLACAEDAAERDLDLEFVIAGNTIDDSRIMATKRAFVTGRYAPEEAVRLIERQHADLGFVASICPETWSLTLSELWRGGLRVAAFDIGTPAERIRRTGYGFLLPLGLSPSAINDALVAAVRSKEGMVIDNAGLRPGGPIVAYDITSDDRTSDDKTSDDRTPDDKTSDDRTSYEQTSDDKISDLAAQSS